ncbi:MAG: hypothetical protein ABSG11_22480 [Candidatus Korobacteraceae bacterium]|jgi:hypothetical protein
MPLLLSLQRIGTGRAVGQFDHSDHRDRDIGIPRLAGDGGKHPPRVLSLTLGRNEHTGIED